MPVFLPYAAKPIFKNLGRDQINFSIDKPIFDICLQIISKQLEGI